MMRMKRVVSVAALLRGNVQSAGGAAEISRWCNHRDANHQYVCAPAGAPDTHHRPASFQDARNLRLAIPVVTPPANFRRPFGTHSRCSFALLVLTVSLCVTLCGVTPAQT